MLIHCFYSNRKNSKIASPLHFCQTKGYFKSAALPLLSPLALGCTYTHKYKVRHSMEGFYMGMCMEGGHPPAET